MQPTTFIEFITSIRKIFDDKIDLYDSLWRVRDRIIDTRFLVVFIMKLIIPKDNRGYSCTLSELFDRFMSLQIPNTPLKIASSSICEARTKLKADIFKEINTEIVSLFHQYKPSPLWYGHRLFVVDGTKLNLPKELTKEGYKIPFDHAHYPQALVSCLYEVLTNIPHNFCISNIINERKCLTEHFKSIPKESVVLLDRGYFSFEILNDFVENGVHPIFRMQIISGYEVLQNFWDGDKTDEIVLLQPPKNLVEEVKSRRSNAKIDPIKVRLIKYKLGENTYVLLTTLYDNKKYPENIFPAVYHSRWGVEEMIKLSKIITGVQDFHSKSENGIKQELYAHFLIITMIKIMEAKAYENIEQKRMETKKPPMKRLRPLNSNERVVSSPKKKDSSMMKSIKINTKNSFLSFERILEKLFFWEVAKFVECTLNHFMGKVETVYQHVRPDRHYPRVSHKPPNRWYGKPKPAFNHISN